LQGHTPQRIEITDVHHRDGYDAILNRGEIMRAFQTGVAFVLAAIASGVVAQTTNRWSGRGTERSFA